MDLVTLGFNCPNLTLNIHLLIIIGIVLILVYFFTPVKYVFHRFNFFNDDVEIQGGAIGIGSTNIRIKPNKKDKEIAYKLWVELSTRKLGIPLDMDNDVIYEVYNSWYEFFKITRESLKEFPVSKLENNNSTETINIAIAVLNGDLRKHLTKWQAKFRHWYEIEIDKEENCNLSPQEIQKKFPEYDELVSDLKNVNICLINYTNLLHDIAFGKKKKK